MYKKRSWGLWLALFLGLMLHGSPSFGADPAHFAALYLDYLPKPVDLPAIAMPDLEGKNVALRSLQGRVVLLNFWTTW
jgi:hypothetical protein